jgi:hypothetical protein
MMISFTISPPLTPPPPSSVISSLLLHHFAAARVGAGVVTGKGEVSINGTPNPFSFYSFTPPY